MDFYVELTLCIDPLILHRIPMESQIIESNSGSCYVCLQIQITCKSASSHAIKNSRRKKKSIEPSQNTQMERHSDGRYIETL